MNELLNMLKIDDLESEQLELAELIGLEAYIKLAEVYAGTSRLSIPPIRILTLPIRDSLIQREFDGNNIYQLAKKWELSDKYIRDIVSEQRQEFKLKPMDGQLSLL